jgi:RecB family exonuclease
VRRDDDRTLSAETTLVVYPTALKAEGVLCERAREAGCLLDHRLTTFPQLTDALARDLGVAPRVLGPEMAAIVLARALERAAPPGPWRVRRRGLLAELGRVVAELKAAYLAPAEVAEIAAALPQGPAAARLATLGRIYAAYETELERLGAVDRHGREWLVCERLAKGGPRPRTLAGVRRLVLAEIYDFSVLQFLIATSLIRMVGDAELVVFAHPENVDATRFLDRTWNRFVGDAAIADQVLPAFVVRGGRHGNLAAALRGVFAAARPEPEPADGSIRLVIAPNRYREVEDAARDVRRRLEAGTAPERLAILARDLTVYRELIDDVCRRYRIPVYFRKGRPILASGLVRTCLNLLRCAADGLPRGRLEALLQTDYLGAADPALARTLTRVGFVAERVRPLAECIDHELARLPATAARRRARLARDGPRLLAFVAALRALDGRRDVAAHVRGLRAVLRRLRLRPAPADGTAPAAARRDARAWERFEQTLAVLAGLADELGLAPLPLAEFVRLLVAALETPEVADAAPRAGGVRALSVLDARGLDFDVVYLLGLDDGTFPAPRGESPLWPDAMKREANAVAAAVLRRKLGARAAGLPLGGLLRTAREASLEDPFLFFLALSMAERQIILSWPAVNESGNPTVASPFVDEVRACVDGLPETRLDPTALVPAVSDCCEPAELVARAALGRWARGPGAPPDALAGALAEALPEGPERIACIDRRALVEERRSRYFLAARDEKEALADAFVGRLGADPGTLEACLRGRRWSPTALNDLGACGFKFFARAMLGLRPDEDPALAVGDKERGTLMHVVLERFFRAHPTLPADLAEARALGRGFLGRVRGEAAGVIGAKDAAAFDVAWGQVAAALDEVIVLEHAAAAALEGGVEVERLLETELEAAIAEPGGGEPILLAGTPDRVDVHHRGAVASRLRVIDYKASRDRARHRRLLLPDKELGTGGFQIPVYLLGARTRVGAAAAEAVLEGGYLLVRAAGEKRVLEEFPTALLDGFVADRIRALVAQARGGRFDVDPAVCDPHCPYRPVCRYQPPPLEEDPGSGG